MMNNIEELNIEYLKINARSVANGVAAISSKWAGETILALISQLDAAQFEIKELTRRLETPVPLPKAAYFKNSAENIPFFRAFSVIEAIHKAGFGTVTYED